MTDGGALSVIDFFYETKGNNSYEYNITCCESCLSWKAGNGRESRN